MHCLQCYKPQQNLPVHLARMCMKKSTPEERAEQVKKARASSREWIRKNRTWDYEQLCQLLPDRRSRITMVKELLHRGFFIMNQPEESDMVLDTEGDSATVDAATTAQSSRDPQTMSASVRIKMKEAGLNDKFPARSKLLVSFKKYLTVLRKVPNWQQEVITLFTSMLSTVSQNHGKYGNIWDQIVYTCCGIGHFRMTLVFNTRRRSFCSLCQTTLSLKHVY